MIELNVRFQEEYKKLDSLCKDMFSSYEGVSEYIRQMESTSFRVQRLVPSWDFEYKQLKHMRWLRNQLAHEVGTLDSDMCTEDDIAWLKSFHGNVLKTIDPLALAAKANKEKGSEAAQYKDRTHTDLTKSKDENKQHESLWKKFVSKIKGIFGRKK